MSGVAARYLLETKGKMNSLPVLHWENTNIDWNQLSIDISEKDGKVQFGTIKCNDFPFRVLCPPAITKYPKLTEHGNDLEDNPFRPSDRTEAQWLVDVWEIDGNGELNPMMKHFFDTVVQPVDEFVLQTIYQHRQKLFRKEKSFQDIQENNFRPVLKVCPKTGYRYMTVSRRMFRKTQTKLAQNFLPICDVNGQVIDYAPDSYDLIRLSAMPKTITKGDGSYGMKWELHTVQVVEKAIDRPPPQFVPEFSADRSQQFLDDVKHSMQAIEM